MTSFRKFVPFLLACVLCMSAIAFADAQKPVPRHHTKKKAAQPPLPAYTPQTLAPLPLDQLPAVPPHVSYQSGQLSIVANNSTLGDILRAVRKQTGADFDVPSNATERVVTDLGPGPARDVLAELLNGSHFDYVMVGSPANPSEVEHLVLTAKSGSETVSASAAGAQPPPRQNPIQYPNREGGPAVYMPSRQSLMQQQGQAQADDTQSQGDDNADNSADDNADQSDENAGDQQQQPGQPQAPKSPEQLLQELQRQQQLQQQVQPGQPQSVYPNGLPNPNQPPANAPEQ